MKVLRRERGLHPLDATHHGGAYQHVRQQKPCRANRYCKTGVGVGWGGVGWEREGSNDTAPQRAKKNATNQNGKQKKIHISRNEYESLGTLASSVTDSSSPKLIFFFL